MAENNCFQERF